MAGDETLESLPRLSRSLLTPGPQPPISHFGLTLLRHVVATALRYSLYQLGMPVPDAPPIRILSLRLYLDATPLEKLLGDPPGGERLLAALLQPSAGISATLPTSIRAAATLHRLRLRLGLHRRRRGRPIDAEGSLRERLWGSFEDRLQRSQPRLGDAMLNEILAVLRQQDVAPEEPAVFLGRQAWKALSGGRCDYSQLGPLDPLHPSWAEDEQRYANLLGKVRPMPMPTLRAGSRGSFREAYRGFLSEVRPSLSALGENAEAEGVVERGEDLFFIPLQLCDELLGERRPTWLDAAVATNRQEYEGLLRAPEHADEIHGSPALAEPVDRSADWQLAPVLAMA